MIQYIVKLEKPEILNFLLGRKIKNMELIFFNQKEERKRKVRNIYFELY